MAMERAATVTVSEQVRMQLNGETPALMDYLKTVKARDAGKSTYDDEPWEDDEKYATADTYRSVVTILMWIVKIVTLWPLLFLLFLPAALYLRVVVALAPCPLVSARSLKHFQLVMVVSHIILLPFFVVALASLLLDYACYYFFGALWCTLTCSWSNWTLSQIVLEPYRGGPPLWQYSVDYLVATMGQLTRRGALFMAAGHAWCVVVVPIDKYWVRANPFLYKLEHRFINQVCTKPCSASLGAETVGLLELLSRFKVTKEQGEAISNFEFAPHYPFPPSERRWHGGMQTLERTLLGCYFTTTMLTHSTHNHCGHGGSFEQLVLSNECVRPEFRVMLWYNNPFHPCTGYVEVNILKSRIDGTFRLEHPMWLVTSRSPRESGTINHKSGVMYVDDLFVQHVLPDYQAEVDKEVAEHLSNLELDPDSGLVVTTWCSL